MEKFTVLTGVAAPLPLINIDTDMIIPKQFLKTIVRTGLGRRLFQEMRYADDGTETPDFVLNQPAYRRAQILIAGENFGCGSSREHAPWALLDFGIRCIIAPSFADIFYNNCFKNGILPARLPRATVDALTQQATRGDGAHFTVDLERCVIVDADGTSHAFTVEENQRRRLLDGLDEIALTLRQQAEIDAYEQRQRQRTPWIFGNAA